MSGADRGNWETTTIRGSGDSKGADLQAATEGATEESLRDDCLVELGSSNPRLVEAMERYKRDLPLLKGHVALLLGVSERTIQRRVKPTGRFSRGGTAWYSRQDIEEIWRGTTNKKSEDTDSLPRKGRSSRSPTGGRGAGRSKSPSRTGRGSERPSVEEVEKRLRGERSPKSASSSVSRLRLVRPI